MAGVSYPSIGEPRPAHLTVASCTHGMIELLLHERGDPPGMHLWFTRADDEAQVEQQAQELAWHWEHLLFRGWSFSTTRESCETNSLPAI